MIAAVNPSSNGFGGGVLATAGRPTAVGGSFASPGTAAGTPPGVPNSSIIEARNNRGSNVQVPYARLVPMHNRENMHAEALAKRSGNDNLKDVRIQGNQLEYDGLHQGELAWILGRRFKSAVNDDYAQGTNDGTIDEFSALERYSHQAFAGLGTGVDRMQRLASTGWVEALFESRLGNARIGLHNVLLDSPYAKAMDSSVQPFTQYLVGASVLHCPDIAWWRANIETKDPLKQVAERRAQGINIIDTSPFLRGVQVNSDMCRFNEGDMSRNQGDVLSMSVLETELRRRNIMDWTPDGIVLSKLESPTDEPMKSTEIDARQAQLFNVGVQGPSITKSWTSDVKNTRLEVQPMDKVFIAVVATLSYRVSETGKGKYEELQNKQQLLINALKEQHKATAEGIDAAKLAVITAINNVNGAANALRGAIGVEGEEPDYDEATLAVKTLSGAIKGLKSDPTASAAAIVAKENALAIATAKLDKCWKRPDDSEITTIKERSNEVRTNTKVVSKAYLTNFRLMRTTSSHMATYSYYKENDEHSRLGLKMGPITGGNDNFSQVRDVIVGGWCVGTVADSAASRSTIGFQTVKSHPTSMAINVNVNVQWWGGDKMYKHYHDAGGLVMTRGKKRRDDAKTPGEDDDAIPLPGAMVDPPNPAVSLSLDGTGGGPFIPPMSNERSVRARADVTGGAGTSGAPRPGGSRRA